MIDMIYVATITFPDGDQIERHGTLQEISSWIDETERGGCNIEIRLKLKHSKSERRHSESELPQM